MFDPRSSTRSTVVFLTALALGGLTACSQSDAEQSTTGPDAAASVGADVAAQAQEIGAAIRAQERHSASLMSRKGVTGTAVGIDSEGRASVRVYLLHGDAAKGIPDHLDGIPVSTVVTGMFVARSDETSRQRPAPIGFSVGHPDITAGTIGARVLDGSSNYFILSNNHVLANSNDASIGDAALQPGPFDGGSDPADQLGTLADYVTILFDGSTNYMDAAIAQVDPDSADYKTPSDEGYGTPNSTLFDIDGDGNLSAYGDQSNALELPVQKYGRTTGHTSGTISEVNVSVNVCYECAGPFCFSCSASAHFEDQIAITPGDFSDGGDSGSLIVTDDGNANPVGLLFAGSSSRTLANRIDRVVNEFGVSIDDGSGDTGGDSNSAPTASFTSSCTDLSCSFDGTGSSDDDGSISSYEWDVDGDGTVDYTGSTADHTYASDGTYTVTLTVTDDDGATDSSSQDVSVSEGNSAPTASFTSSCTDLSCSFDGTGSSDDDGSISSYEWDVDGDGTVDYTGSTANHTYASDGTYTVTLTVTDDDGATDTSSQDVTVSSSTAGGIHVGDLDGTQSSQGSTWTAELMITVHDTDHTMEDGSTVDVSYDSRDVSGSASCTTATDGTCSISVSNIHKRSGTMTFTVVDVSDSDGTYHSDSNHDPDGDSDGTTITVSKP